MRNLSRIVGILLIAGGVLMLVYRGFTYTKESHDAEIGPLELQWNEKEHVNFPTWAGVGAIVAGAGALLVGRGGSGSALTSRSGEQAG